VFDTGRFLKDHFTDVDGVLGLLSAHGYRTPQREAVKKWFSRSSIPWEWGIILIIVAQAELETREPLNLGAYTGNDSYDIFA